MDYRQTLNLPLQDKDKGAFHQRANLPYKEPEIQRRWEEERIYQLTLKRSAPKGKFILHDGPPYSNGDIHLGHALNKISKDIIVKYKTMQGYCAPYVPGWDNHGMPIENEVAKEFRHKGIKPDTVTMRRRCREYAAHYVNEQRKQFQRLGVRGDWSNPYLTMDTAFEAKIVRIFGQLAEKGYIYRGLKPVLWCAQCETALADAEVEYSEHVSQSIIVRMPLRYDPNGVFHNFPNSYALIWTTTPWTIPANLAVAAHPDAAYAVVRTGENHYLMAEALVERTVKAISAGDFQVLSTCAGSDLVGLVFNHPMYNRDSPLVMAPYVTMEDGTGLVHTAPGHGKEDFETGQIYQLPVLCPVDTRGRFTDQVGKELAGARILGGEADAKVMEALREIGSLLAHEPYPHSYPHCWRCHSPLLFRATIQWFMAIDHSGHRQNSLDAIQKVQWYPAASINRISSMVANRPDWCLSRQRAWGVGIHAFYCEACNEPIITPETIEAIAQRVEKDGSDAWFALPAEEILPTGFKCPKCSAAGPFRKETDILDVWFDSGSTHIAVLEAGRWPDISWPADLYLEGNDQHRGWFNSSLMVSVALKNEAPYRQVVTNGWTLDENGKAMHKSLGNAIAPTEAVEKYGADILRLWVASADTFEDVRCSNHILEQVAEIYRRIRNTFRFCLNALYDFDMARDEISQNEMEELDRWVIAKLTELTETIQQAYDGYEFHRVTQSVHQFCTVTLSAFYLDVIKDRLYASTATSRERRSAQTALHILADRLARILAPILSHTSEEVWDHLTQSDRPQSVQLADFPPSILAGYQREILMRWRPLMELREEINRKLEEARQTGKFSNPLDARLVIQVNESEFQRAFNVKVDLSAIFKVSQVSVEKVTNAEATPIAISVEPAEGQKCARCWLVRPEVGRDSKWPDLCGRCVDVVSTLPSA